MARTSAEYLRISIALSDLEKLEQRFSGIPKAEEEILGLISHAKEYLEDRKVLVSHFKVGNRESGRA
jgi:hypothetical protein